MLICRKTSPGTMTRVHEDWQHTCTGEVRYTLLTTWFIECNFNLSKAFKLVLVCFTKLRQD